MDSIKYTGPVALAGDCTKVRARLMFSNDYGSHILGSTLTLDEVAVKDTNDIEDVVERVTREKKFASQVRAILIKVRPRQHISLCAADTLLKIPLPHIPPLVIALIPTKGNNTAANIHSQHQLILKMASQLKIAIVSMAADGASTELGAQSLMDNTQSSLPPLAYKNTHYGVDLRAPVFDNTGPLIAVQDPQHARKTCRNQPQHGTHTASLGSGYLVNRSLVQLYETWISGLQLRDVQDVDKQDDGAARRFFHHMAISATTFEKTPGKPEVREQFKGLFVYLFIFGRFILRWRMPKADIVFQVNCLTPG